MGLTTFPPGGASAVSPEIGYLSCPSYLAEGDELKAATATSTSPQSYTFTLTGSQARTVKIILASSAGSYTGTFTLTGGKPGGGGSHSKVCTPATANGDETLDSVKAFAPGTITLDLTAMGNTSGHFTVQCGDGFGLESRAAEGGTDTNYDGHVLSISIGNGESSVSGMCYIAGPTASSPNGALRFPGGSLSGIMGNSPFHLAYARST